MMTKERALDILIAVGICSVSELSCEDCPLCGDPEKPCSAWTEDDVAEAVKVLNRDRRGE